MQTVHYKSGRLGATPLIGAIFTFGAGFMWWSGGGWVALVMMLVFGFMTAVGVSNAVSGEPPLRWDDEGLAMRSGGRSHRVDWSSVQSISAETITMRYYFVIPVHRTSFLVIKVDGGLIGGKRLRLNADSLALPANGLPLLIGALNRAHVTAVGEAGIAMKGAGPQGWGARSASNRVVLPDETPSSSGFTPMQRLPATCSGRRPVTDFRSLPRRWGGSRQRRCPSQAPRLARPSVAAECTAKRRHLSA